MEVDIIDLTDGAGTTTPKKSDSRGDGGNTAKKAKKVYAPKHGRFSGGGTNKPPGYSPEMEKFNAAMNRPGGAQYTCPVTSSADIPTVTTASDLFQPIVPNAYGDFAKNMQGDLQKWHAAIDAIRISALKRKIPSVKSLDFDSAFMHMTDYCIHAATIHGDKYGWDSSRPGVLCESVKKFSLQVR